MFKRIQISDNSDICYPFSFLSHMTPTPVIFHFTSPWLSHPTNKDKLRCKCQILGLCSLSFTLDLTSLLSAHVFFSSRTTFSTCWHAEGGVPAPHIQAFSIFV